MINTKVATLKVGAIDTGEDSTTGFTSVATPTTKLSWDHLNPLRRNAAQRWRTPRPGHVRGYAGVHLGHGPGMKRALFQTDT